MHNKYIHRRIPPGRVEQDTNMAYVLYTYILANCCPRANGAKFNEEEPFKTSLHNRDADGRQEEMRKLGGKGKRVNFVWKIWS